MRNFARIVIAGVRGGSGKTTLSLGLISALRSGRGLRVVPFKKGPDFIDAGWMSLAAENPCYNLDPFLIPSDRIMDSFLSHSTGDISVIEGNRGLHDGMDAEGSYSTGELAKLLKAPVILIIDCTKMTRTAAAVVLGCMNLDKDVAIKGVVLNQVSGARHEKVVRESIEKYCSIPVLGAFPRLKSGDFPERHMGLTPHQEHEAAADSLSFVRDLAVEYLDLDRILEIARDVETIEDPGAGGQGPEKEVAPHASRLTPSVKIGVIRDRAFQFYYPENFEELRKSGAELVEINALSDAGLPGIDGLYIGGGFPETNALLLAGNEGFRRSVKDAAEAGLPIYAECGGLMFLGEAIIVKGERYPMAGVFPLVFEMREKPQAHGYTIVEADRENPFYPEGTVLRGHEFHYSEVVDGLTPPHPPLGKGGQGGVGFAFRMKRGHGIQDKRDGIFYKNVLATYTHIHALGAGPWVEGMIRKAREYKEQREARVS